MISVFSKVQGLYLSPVCQLHHNDTNVVTHPLRISDKEKKFQLTISFNVKYLQMPTKIKQYSLVDFLRKQASE